MSESIALGDWRLLFLQRDRIRNVKVADVQQAAAHYLKAANRTLGQFIPTDKPDRAPLAKAPVIKALRPRLWTAPATFQLV